MESAGSSRARGGAGDRQGPRGGLWCESEGDWDLGSHPRVVPKGRLSSSTPQCPGLLYLWLGSACLSPLPARPLLSPGEASGRSRPALSAEPRSASLSGGELSEEPPAPGKAPRSLSQRRASGWRLASGAPGSAPQPARRSQVEGPTGCQALLFFYPPCPAFSPPFRRGP